jgi:large subunit ribosomal protein L1
MPKAKKTTKKISKKNLPEKYFVKTIEEAIQKVKDLSLEKKRNFVESIDIAVNLGVDTKQTDQTVKGTVLLPNGSGKKVKILAFVANDEQKRIALEAGAMNAGLEDMITKIEGGFVDFDCCVATPDVMPKISKIARKLGPRGLMPSPKNGTVTNDLKKAISDALKGKVDFKNDKGGTIHCLIGKVNFDNEAIIENIKSVIKAIKDSRPENAKGKFIKAFYISSTMGSSVEVATDGI